jgi:hypothetical protein
MPYMSVVVATGDTNDVPIKAYFERADAEQFVQAERRMKLLHVGAKELLACFDTSMEWSSEFYDEANKEALALLSRHIVELKDTSFEGVSEAQKHEHVRRIKFAITLATVEEQDKLVELLRITTDHKIYQVPYTPKNETVA